MVENYITPSLVRIVDEPARERVLLHNSYTSKDLLFSEVHLGVG